jgi:hypothetical protein
MNGRRLCGAGFVVAMGMVSAVACGTDAALTPADCPGAATSVTVNAVAPYWGGLVELSYKVPGGVPSDTDLAIYDPALKLWTPTYASNADQRDDGTFVSLVTVFNVTRFNSDMPRKLRVRSRLDGCPASAWAESKTFTLGDPLAGTTWVATFESGDLSGNVSVAQEGPPPPSFVGPYGLDDTQTWSHSIRFGTDGTFQEEVKLGIKSHFQGDGYNGCTFDVHLIGDYTVVPDQTAVFLSNRQRAADPGAGSVCGAPAVTDTFLYKSNPPTMIPSTQISINSIDYSGLVASPPGKVIWNESGLTQTFNAVLPLLSTGISGVSGSVYTSHSPAYEKQ